MSVRKRIFFVTLMLSLVLPTYASSKAYVDINVGTAITRLGNTQSAWFNGNSRQDTFVGQRSNNPRLVAELGGGVEFPLSGHWYGRLGLKQFYQNLGKISGTREIFTNLGPNPDTTNYHFYGKAFGVMLTTQVGWQASNHLDYYGLLGLGGAWVQLNRYAETGPNAIPGTSASFASKTTGSFAAELGFGLRYYLTQHNTLAAEYRYRYIGAASLGRGLGQNNSDTPGTGHIGTNMFMLAMSHYFN